jgi:hypothetical protein
MAVHMPTFPDVHFAARLHQRVERTLLFYHLHYPSQQSVGSQARDDCFYCGCIQLNESDLSAAVRKGNFLCVVIGPF